MEDLELLEKYVAESVQFADNKANENNKKRSSISDIEEFEEKEEKKDKKKNKKGSKEISEKKLKLNERISVLNATKKFNILPDIDINKEELAILKELANGNKDYMSLCKNTDLKPSKLDKCLNKLSIKNMLIMKDGNITITELGISFSKKTKGQDNRNRKFQKFIKILTDEEFNQFVEMIKSFKSNIK